MLTSHFVAATYLTMVAALSSIMERSRLANDVSRPAVASSIFLSGNGKPLAIVVVVLVWL
jgi:hypothetical protein